VSAILRVIILGLARYNSAVLGKNIIINGLMVLRGVDTAHACLAREGLGLFDILILNQWLASPYRISDSAKCACAVYKC